MLTFINLGPERAPQPKIPRWHSVAASFFSSGWVRRSILQLPHGQVRGFHHLAKVLCGRTLRQVKWNQIQVNIQASFSPFNNKWYFCYQMVMTEIRNEDLIFIILTCCLSSCFNYLNYYNNWYFSSLSYFVWKVEIWPHT